MKFLAALALALLFLSAPGFAEPAQPERQVVQTQDTPPGHPYNVGRTDTSQVSLRDFLSSRIDQVEQQLLRLLDERDRQYAQRFEAQQKALADALAASKESGAKELQATKEQAASALMASEKALIKAEDASNKTWALVGAVVLLLISVGTFVINVRRDQKATK